MQDKTFQLEAIPFIQLQQSGFSLHEEAHKYLSSLGSKEIGVLSVVGRYRTGKSFLLNKLLKHRPMKSDEGVPKFSGFKVGPTINPCTKGLWLLKHVFYFCKEDASIHYTQPNEQAMPVLVVDTEGLGGFDEEENHDTKIFLMGMLLSSLMVYNSLGPIDEGALNNISLIINLSKTLRVKKTGTESMDQQEFASYFPSLIWVLRDFMLRMEDRDGNRITPKEYLENSLTEQRGSSENVQSKNRIRRLLRQFFKDRDCSILVRPVEEEKDLQKLDSMPDRLLRKEFLEQLTSLRKKVVRKMKLKRQNARTLSGPMLVELALTYVKALNSEKIPVIENAWTNVCRSECERVKGELMEDFTKIVTHQIAPKLPLGKKDLQAVLQRIINDKKKNFTARSLGDEQGQFVAALMTEMEKEIKRLTLKNERMLVQKFEEEMERGFSEIQQGVKFRTLRTMAEYRDKVEQFQKKFANVEPELVAKLNSFLTSKVLAHGEAIFREQISTQQQEMRVVKARLRAVEEELSRKRRQLATERQNFGSNLNNLEAQNIQMEAKNTLLKQQLAHLQQEKERSVTLVKGQMEVKLRAATDALQEKRKENQILKARAKKSEHQVEALKAELTRINSINQQNAQILEQQLSLWKERAEEQQSEVKAVRGRLDEAQGEVSETKQMLLNKQQELTSVLTREKENDCSDCTKTKQLEVEKAFTEKQNVFLKEQLNQNHKIYQNLVSALKLENGAREQLPSGEDIILETNKALMRAIAQGEKQRTEVEGKLTKLKKFQRMLRGAASLVCKGCEKQFPSSLFAAHLKVCSRLPLYAQDAEADQIHIRLNEVEKAGPLTHLHLSVSYGANVWTLKREMAALASLIQQISGEFQYISISDVDLSEKSDYKHQVQKVFQVSKNLQQQIECLHVLKKFEPFRDFIALNSHLEAASPATLKGKILPPAQNGLEAFECEDWKQNQSKL